MYSFGDFTHDISAIHQPFIGVANNAIGTVGGVFNNVLGIFGGLVKGITSFFSGNTFIIIAIVIAGVSTLYFFKR